MARAQVSQAQPSEATTVIGAGIRVNGRVSGGEDLHVEGRVEGSINLSETLFVAGDGIVVAEVQARDVVVSGIVVGNVSAEDSVTLNPGAKLVGDITAPRLIIADGAAFSGNVAMGGEAPPRRERARESSAAPPGRRQAAARPQSVATGRRQGTAARAGKTEAKAAAPAPARVAAIPKPQTRDDEVTVVVRHAALRSEGGDSRAAEGKGGRRANAPKKKAKKAPPRARVPKPGKRRVSRRS